ncbi:MAG: CDP-diacylglycerol--glycerol-3-phosphate 3-phosphatidyltransferase [Labilithrix sp.]|nr:CDP-diacylglycerol--glycerol-3-phosphate 3-phosphatidyltransferase [Labilithrix sp.]
MPLSHVLLRHQAGSIVATIVDYTVMIALVSLLGTSPTVGTAAGAATGGTVNFILGRRWIFRSTGTHPAPQAGRYAMVSMGSLVLNTCGVHVLADIMHYPYVAARFVVSFVVSLLWNFPLQRSFVFGGMR